MGLSGVQVDSSRVRLKQVRPAAFYYGPVKPKRRRRFQGYAKRWQYGMRARQPGKRVQIDPMRIGFTEGFSIKEFKAAGPVTELVALKADSRATRRCAQDFLAHLIEQAPFKIRSIQVDGVLSATHLGDLILSHRW